MANILVVDDTPADRNTIVRVLATEGGHRVRSTDSGAEAVRLYQEKPDDLVILDVVLPRKKGVDQPLVALVRAFPEIRVLVTARGGETISSRAYLEIAGRGEAVRALPKPFTPAQLLRAVRVMVEGGEWIS